MRASILFSLALVACDGMPGTGDELVGEQAPDFALKDADGTEHRLSDQAGNVVVIDFSAMWCTRCKEAAPELEALSGDRAADGVQVWVVLFQDADGDDPDAKDLNNWTQAFELTHPVLADEEEMVWSEWGRGHQPVIFVVSGDREVVWAGDGSGRIDEIDAAIDTALGGAGS